MLFTCQRVPGRIWQPAGAWLYPYVVGYFAVLAAIGLWAFNRKDL